MFLDFVYEYVEIIPRSRHISSENYLSSLQKNTVTAQAFNVLKSSIKHSKNRMLSSG